MPNMDMEQGLRQAIDLMENLISDGARLDSLPRDLREHLMRTAGRLTRPDRDLIRARQRQIDHDRRQKIVKADKQARASTGIREARRQSVFVAPARIEALATGPSDSTAQTTTTSTSPNNERVLHQSRYCYVCKAEFRKLHFFYDSMCETCADFNYQKRFQTAPLHGQVAVITGGRLKIGYQSALMMLRAGARVIVTTRFPVDSAARFAREPDYSEWGDRVEVHGLDLRHIPSVELFTQYLEQRLDRLDLLINNAAQTVRRPPGFYAHMMENELIPYADQSDDVRRILHAHEECKTRLNALSPPNPANLPVSWHGQGPGVGLRASAKLSQIPYSIDHALVTEEAFPKGELDADLQQVDLRGINSWRLGLADVATPEMVEVQLVNSIAPFVLCSRLTPLMRRNPTGQKHMVNVSAMEGKFNRHTKTDKHPHTNMAKAALNMMTLTSSKELVRDGIHMNAVDTGWVTDEDPAALSRAKQEMHDFQPPLDIVDGAARVCDPFFHGILSGTHWNGKFLKDYFPTDW